MCGTWDFGPPQALKAGSNCCRYTSYRYSISLYEICISFLTSLSIFAVCSFFVLFLCHLSFIGHVPRDSPLHNLLFISWCFFPIQMRYTKNVSVWPVAFVGGLRYETVKVNAKGKVVGWSVKFDPSRPFSIDMAGFAINLKRILENPRAMFHLDAKPGSQESSLLQDLVTRNELEPKAENCSKVRCREAAFYVRNIGQFYCRSWDSQGESRL